MTRPTALPVALVAPEAPDFAALLRRRNPGHAAWLDLTMSKRLGQRSGMFMEGDDDPELDDDGNPVEPDDDAETKKRNAAQQRIAKREKTQGRRAGIKEVMDKLGFATVEEAEKFIKDKKAADDAAADEVTKREQAIAERERKAEEREAKAARRERETTAKDLLRDAGATGTNVKDALRLLDVDLDDEDLEDDDYEDAIEQLKDRRPELFGEGDDDDDDDTRRRAAKKAPPSSTIKGKPTERNKNKATAYGAGGLERARRKGWLKKDDDK